MQRSWVFSLVCEVDLTSPTTVVPNNFLKSMLLLIMRINVRHVRFQPMLNF